MGFCQELSGVQWGYTCHTMEIWGWRWPTIGSNILMRMHGWGLAEFITCVYIYIYYNMMWYDMMWYDMMWYDIYIYIYIYICFYLFKEYGIEDPKNGSHYIGWVQSTYQMASGGLTCCRAGSGMGQDLSSGITDFAWFTLWLWLT